MKAEEYYKKIHCFPGIKMEDKYDKHAEIFDYYDLMSFATQFSESQNKELIEDLKGTLIDFMYFQSQHHIEQFDDFEETVNEYLDTLKTNKK